MGLIKKPSELQVQTTIKALLYGQPGIGKTTDALSAPYPVLLELRQRRSSRQCRAPAPARFRHAPATIFSPRRRAGARLAQDYRRPTRRASRSTTWGARPIQADPKLGQRDGSLSLKGYGARKAEFIRVLKSISIMGKHIVFVAHEREEKEGDQKIIRPEIGGSLGRRPD